MPATTFATNGNGKTATLPPEVLPYLQVDSNSYRRVSVNCAWTYRRTTGHFDLALTLWDELLNALKTQAAARSVDLDSVNLDAIRTIVEQRLQGLAELTDIPTDDLERQHRVLREISSRKPTKLVRQLQEVVTLAVAEALGPVRRALHDYFDQAPLTCLAGIQSVAEALRDFTYPTPDFRHQKRFASGLRAIDFIGRTAWLPLKLRDTLTTTLRKRCVAEFQEAIAILETDYVTGSLRQAIAEFLPYLDELRSNQAAFRRNASTVKQLLDEQRTHARQRIAQSRSSVLLEIESPDEIQLLAGIRDHHRCTDTPALVQLFWEKLHLTLNEAARQRHPFIRTPASFTELLVKLSPRTTVAGVVEVVAELVGDLHTVYTAVRAFGVERATRELFDRAAPLCSLSSRDNIRLNVEPHRDLIVRLPRPRGPDDGDIAERLRHAFRSLQPACQFLEDRLDSEITVVRSLVGFPIGIEATNAALLFDYAESARQGHRPHLVGFLADAPRGQHLSQLLALAQHSIKH